MGLKKSAREYLLDAIRLLVSQKPIEDITVAEVVKLAGVSRNTFYKHFEDKFALAEQVFVDEISAAFFFCDQPMYDRAVGTLHRVDENRQFYRNAVKSEEFLKKWMEHAFESDLAYLQGMLEGRSVPEGVIRDMAELITQTLAGGVLEWVRGRPDRAPEDYARVLVTYCEHGLSGFVAGGIEGF